jgi:HD superfamily phosphohydrolase
MRAIGREDFDHEIVAPQIIQHDSEVASALDGIGDRVSRILQKQEGLLSHIISGALDADKLDYLRRDAYYAGVSYGVFDIERILRSVCGVRSAGEDYLAVEWKAKDALENYRLARYSMHVQVYEHKTRLIADDLFVRAYWFAAEEKIVPKDDLLSLDPVKFLPAYTSLDDASVELTILRESKGLAKEIIQRLRSRKLLKRAYELPLTKQAAPDQLKRNELGKISRKRIPEIEQELAGGADCDAHWVIVHPQTIPIKLYERFDQKEGEDASALLIRRQDRMSVTSMEDESPITSLPEPIRRIFVFCPEECVRRVHELSVRMFGFPGAYTPGPGETGPRPPSATP